MRYLLDTSACLAHYRAEPGAEQVQGLFVRDDAEILLCCVTLAEMARRLRELGVPEERNRQVVGDYQDLAAGLVPVTAEVARKADQIALRAGGRLPLADALIAAAAASRDAVLVHRDRHMQAIPRDEVEQLDLAAASPPDACGP